MDKLFETLAMIAYPPQDGGQPGYDRNETARRAFIKGAKLMKEILDIQAWEAENG